MTDAVHAVRTGYPVLVGHGFRNTEGLSCPVALLSRSVCGIAAELASTEGRQVRAMSRMVARL